MQTYALGVGDIYITTVTDATIPSDSAFETTSNKIGSTSGGATLTYTAENYAVQDDAYQTLDVVKTGEAVSLKGNILTWDLDVLGKLAADATVTSTSETTTLKLGSKSNTMKKIATRFVHTMPNGKKLKATLVGNSTAGFELAFAKDKETIIPFEINALSQSDGTLCTITLEN